MFSGINETRKNAVNITEFRGLNHTDVPRRGEWFDLMNISGNTLSENGFSALVPRRTREKIEELPIGFKIKSLIYKNGYYIFSDIYGRIYEKGGIVPIHYSDSGAAYKLIEMGNRVLCLCEHSSRESGYLELGSEMPGNHFTFVPFVNYKAKLRAKNDNDEVFEPVYYYLHGSNNSYISELREENGDIVKSVSNIPGGSYDAQSKDFLNIGFRFCTENNNGEQTPFNRGHLSTAQEIKAMTESQFYIATDKKLYYYDAQSKSSREITTPKIAMFVKKGIGNGVPANVEKGDVVTLNIGPSINLSHPSVWNKTDDDYYYQPRSFIKTLKVEKFEIFSESSNSVWHETYKWDFYYIFDYDAELLKWIIDNNLVHDTEHYSRKIDANCTTEVTNLRFVREEIETEAAAGWTYSVRAEGLNIYPAGTEKFYPITLSVTTDFPGKMAGTLERNNRIWCADNSVNEIRASAQGNFKNWLDYSGVSSDSFAASIGSEGEFTASCCIEDYLFFFKERSFTMLYGTKPANFTTNTVKDFVGIKASDSESLQVIGKSAFFLGSDGRVYRFNGSTATNISQALGDERYRDGVGTHNAGKYYLLTTNKRSEQKELLVYNTVTGDWFKEDCENIDTVLSFLNKACALLPISSTSDSTLILDLDKTDIPVKEESGVEWFCESGLLGLESDFNLFISKLQITMCIEPRADVSVYVKYDNNKSYELLKSFKALETQTVSETIKLKRCQFFRLKIIGRGFAKIYKIAYQFEGGSEK